MTLNVNGFTSTLVIRRLGWACVSKWLLIALLLVMLLPLFAQNSVTDFEQAIFTHTNRERAAHNLPALIYDRDLADLARGHSRNMLNQNYFDHTDKEGLTVGGRQEKHYPNILVTTIGENLYTITDSRHRFSSQEIVQGWMDSPGHRANILNADFTHLGVGVVRRGETLYATQNFATPVVKVLSPMPINTRLERIKLEFEYLSTRASRDFRATLIYPDPSLKHWLSDSEYIEGAEYISPRWTGGKRFSMWLEFPAGSGDYGLHFGWGQGYMADGFRVRKQ